MKITEALRIIRDAPVDAPSFPVLLACGFTPLHLETFLAAHLQRLLPARRVQIRSEGLYGNLAGTLESISANDVPALCVVLEWSDLDPRLGYRQTGNWGPSDIADIVVHAGSMLQRLNTAIERISPAVKIALSLPTLHLPPAFHTPGWQLSEAELRIRERLIAFAACLARFSHISIASGPFLDQESSPSSRFHLKSEVLTGLPYTLTHADQLASVLARLVVPPAPKKGLITDLDDTLWSGLVGEIGPDSVAWDLKGDHHIHALYQRVLMALAEHGVLIGIASKNDPQIAAAALGRKDMLLHPDKVFPIEVHWHAKSGSVDRILRTWNIAADSVVFVDDSPMELAEVQAAHPAMHCMLFPKSDYAAADAFLRTLRDLFAKPRITEEDSFRLESIKRSAEFQQMVENGGAVSEDFLRQMNGQITFDLLAAASDPRTLELVNKTNQFNLNGKRYNEHEWQTGLKENGAFVMSVAYEDKFGPLGKIAVLRGLHTGSSIHLQMWVMSCRAFARRIEHQSLKCLFELFPTQEIHFDFKPTPKNNPIAEFFSTLLGTRPGGPFSLEKTRFEEKCPVLYHEVSTIHG